MNKHNRTRNILGLVLCLSLLSGCSIGLTPVKRNDPLSFGVITDVQYCDCNAEGERVYRESPQKLKTCVNHLNQMDLDFVIHLGDLIDQSVDSFDAILPILARLKAPVYHVLGNHDYEVDDTQKSEVPQRLHMPAPYYDFVIGAWRFVVLNGNDLSLSAYAEGCERYVASQKMLKQLQAEDRPNARVWNGGLGPQQIAWLQDRLTLASTQQQKVIVFCHWPVYPPASHNLWNDTELRSLLESYRCVVAYLNGHNHAGDYGQRNGIHYITFKAMLDHKDRTAYAVVHCRKDTLRIMGFGDESSRTLELR